MGCYLPFTASQEAFHCLREVNYRRPFAAVLIRARIHPHLQHFDCYSNMPSCSTSIKLRAFTVTLFKRKFGQCSQIFRSAS